MRTNRQLALGVLGVVAAMTIAVFTLIVPSYREAGVIRKQVRDLERRAASLDTRTEAVDRLARDVETARKGVEQDLKIIPESPDVAGLIRKLSYPIDGVTVADQTFTAGSPAPAAAAGDSIAAVTADKSSSAQAQALPVTIEMQATFESVLGMIHRAEELDRLIRVASVRLLCRRDDRAPGGQPRAEPRNELPGGIPVLKASVGLEVVYEPGS